MPPDPLRARAVLVLFLDAAAGRPSRFSGRAIQGTLQAGASLRETRARGVASCGRCPSFRGAILPAKPLGFVCELLRFCKGRQILQSHAEIDTDLTHSALPRGSVSR